MDTYQNYVKIRDGKGLKDSYVAKAAGISQSTFTDWKSGKSKPKMDKLSKIADALQISVDYLMTGTKTAKDLYMDYVAETSFTDDETDLIRNYRKLNAQGQEKVKEYCSDLVDNGRYIKNNGSEVVEKKA